MTARDVTPDPDERDAADDLGEIVVPTERDALGRLTSPVAFDDQEIADQWDRRLWQR